MRRVTTILWLFLAVTLCIAQSDKKKSGNQPKPDLSGTWILDKSKSSELEYDLTLTIVHREPEIRITRQLKADGQEQIEELIYYTDGRAEWDSRRGSWDKQSMTRWSGRKLIHRRDNSNPLASKPRVVIDIVTTEEWELSKDGKTLTRTTSSSGSGVALLTSKGSQASSRGKFVFNRGS